MYAGKEGRKKGQKEEKKNMKAGGKKVDSDKERKGGMFGMVGKGERRVRRRRRIWREERKWIVIKRKGGKFGTVRKGERRTKGKKSI